ncbi:MAG: hypothetical protein IJO38_10505 [Akkermansia sp.]|nr:hypothetical protein [Akkermansia sp.]
MIPFLAQAAESISQPLFSGWDPAVTTGGTAAVVLGAIWVFFKVVRAVVATLFMLCVVFLVLKVCFDIDLSTWLRPVFESILSGNL